MKAAFSRCLPVVAMLVLCVFPLGCATHIRQPKTTLPTAKKISTYKAVQLMPVTLSPAYANNGANNKAAKKINENLLQEMRSALPNLQTGDQTAVAGTLVITPLIEEVKFIGGFARFMVGALAGSSAVLMKVTYQEAGTGTVIGEPEFYRAGNAMGGAYSMGSTDNMMLVEIARDIAHYTKMNY